MTKTFFWNKKLSNFRGYNQMTPKIIIHFFSLFMLGEKICID